MSISRIDADDAIILFADLQMGIADLPLTIAPEKLKQGVTALAKLAKLFNIPVIVSAIPGPDGTATIMPQITAELGEITVNYRATADSFRNDQICDILEKSGRKTVLISGVATELAVQLPALTGVDLGYRTFVVVDACGGISARTEAAALSRVQANGGSCVSVFTLAGELVGPFDNPASQAAVAILFSLAASGS